jgi:hypothetical protein
MRTRMVSLESTREAYTRDPWRKQMGKPYVRSDSRISSNFQQ